ncbi:MAG: pyridoxamine 5'-phosphate oxidase family protein [Candidatus Omnitrophica bacterium]|nr:pyridoxamine 5'-phosphate oxidase family protein [Candidatus Omnitrophota bacterium]
MRESGTPMTHDSKRNPGNDLVPLVDSLVGSAKVLTIAVSDPAPWSAPVYYVLLNRGFYFFSNPNSRHVASAIQSGRCAVSIFRDSEDWREIEGVQMEGYLLLVDEEPEASRAMEIYLQKFPMVGDFFPGENIDLERFIDRFHAELYAFLPLKVFYLNNRAGLGTRQEIVWGIDPFQSE